MALPAPADVPSPAVPLPGLAALRVIGQDRVTFLQGQLTADVRQLVQGTALLAGWCTAQGRLLAVGWLFAAADACYWSVPAELADDLQRRLRMFVLRATVGIERDDRALWGGWQAPDAPGWPCARLPLAPDRWLFLVDRGAERGAEPAAEAVGAARWCAADVAAGIPTIGAATRDLFVPQMLNLDLLGGIGFTKGCYAGQEIVTRTQRLGRLGRRMFRYRVADRGAQVPQGTALTREDGREVGRVLRSCDTPDGTELLAVVQVAEAALPLQLAGTPVRHLERLPLPYVIPGVAQVAPG